MFSLTEPSDSDIVAFISAQSDRPFSYAEVGATRGSAPSGYNVDHNRIQLGSGAEVYERAVVALKLWRQFQLGWVTVAPRGVKIETGATVAKTVSTCVEAWGGPGEEHLPLSQSASFLPIPMPLRGHCPECRIRFPCRPVSSPPAPWEEAHAPAILPIP